MDMTVETIQTLEEASNLMLHALRRDAQARQDRDAGAAEYDSWIANLEYDSWSANFASRPGRT